MKHRPVKTIWLSLICFWVFVYLFLLGQVNVRQFQNKQTLSSQKVLLQLAEAKQQHCNDLFDLLSWQLRHTAGKLSSIWKISGQAEDTLEAVKALWGPMVLSMVHINAEGQILRRYPNVNTAEDTVSYSSLSAAFRQGNPALDEVFAVVDGPCISMLYPISEGTTFCGGVVFRIPVDQLLKRLNEDTLKSGINICLADGEGNILKLAKNAEVISLHSRMQDIQTRTMLNDIYNRRGGIGVFSDDAQKSPSACQFLAGYWPLDKIDSPWSIMAIQDDYAIQTTVGDHARSIQLGMVCLFLTVCFIGLLSYRNIQRSMSDEKQEMSIQPGSPQQPVWSGETVKPAGRESFVRIAGSLSELDIDSLQRQIDQMVQACERTLIKSDKSTT